MPTCMLCDARYRYSQSKRALYTRRLVLPYENAMRRSVLPDANAMRRRVLPYANAMQRSVSIAPPAQLLCTIPYQHRMHAVSLLLFQSIRKTLCGCCPD
eukprot:2148533-Rhodomonas_salina.1